MKVYKIRIRDKLFVIKDDRLSPMTYAKLKELGYGSEDWKNWSQEQANKIVQQGIKKKSNNPTGKRSESSNSQSIGHYETLSHPSDLTHLLRENADAVGYPFFKDACNKYTNQGINILQRFRQGTQTPEDKDVVATLKQSMRPMDKNIKLYRTNNKITVKNNSGLEKNPLTSASIYSDMVIPENEGRVVEVIEFLVDAGVPMCSLNNSGEGEVLLDSEHMNYEVVNERYKDGISYKTIRVMK